jgi:penicillin V acylase-like amidase (Ntn superfamily)
MRVLIAILTLVAATAADACTTFCTRGLFGRNYDFEIGYGMVMTNKRGVRKSSSQTPKPAEWTSRYGSLTFNQFGRDNPTGGMNEQGLVVELMWLDGTRYPAADARPELGTLEWIQYQLDTASTVAEVLANAEKVRIAERGVPLHYLIADAKGDSAAVEFFDGKLVVSRGATALANEPYATKSASDRFMRARRGVANATTIDAAFSLLDDVAQPHTQWSIVYDLRDKAVHWRTAANRTRRSVKLAAFDFRCATPVRVSDIDANEFRDYTRAANEALVRRSTRGTSFTRNTPDAEIEAAARWPERATCAR